MDSDSIASFILGFIVGILVIYAIANVGVTQIEKSTEIASLEAIEKTDLRIMMSEQPNMRVVRFATDEGYAIYYDGALYMERE